MICPLCGAHTVVTDSRTPQWPGRAGTLVESVSEAAEVLVAEDAPTRMRRRRCRAGHTFVTVEVSLPVLIGLLQK